MMKITEAERKAINAVIVAGRYFGYRNMIVHLQTAWARMIMEEMNVDEATARQMAQTAGDGYPFGMQEDILLRGEWDETGEKYKEKTGEQGP